MRSGSHDLPLPAFALIGTSKDAAASRRRRAIAFRSALHRNRVARKSDRRINRAFRNASIVLEGSIRIERKFVTLVKATYSSSSGICVAPNAFDESKTARSYALPWDFQGATANEGSTLGSCADQA